MAGISFTQWYRGTGRQKTTEGTGDHQNQQGTRDPPKKKQRNRQNVGKPPNKSLGRGKSWGQEASQQKQRPRPLRGGKNPTWGEGFPPPWALMRIHISKGAYQKSYGSGKLKKNTWEGLFFSDDPKSSNLGSASLTWRPLWPGIPQVPWR